MKKRNRKRVRNRHCSPYQSLQPPQLTKIAQKSDSLPLLPLYNVGGLSNSEIKKARQPRSPNCISCGSMKFLQLLIGWRSATGIPYIAAYCSLCINEVNTPGVDRMQKEPYEIELKIDLELFEATTAQEGFGKSGVLQ